MIPIKVFRKLSSLFYVKFNFRLTCELIESEGMFNKQPWTKEPCFGLSSSPNVSGLALHQWTYKYARIVARCELIESFRSRRVRQRGRDFLNTKVLVKRATETYNLFCNIAAEQVEKRCCAFYYPSSNLLTTWAQLLEAWLALTSV